MKRTLTSLLLLLCAMGAWFAVPAFAADDANPGGAETSAEDAGAAEEEAQPTPNINGEILVATAVETARAAAGINRDQLFLRQFDWEAVETQNFDSANEDGSLSEWQIDWYITHDWSDYGYVISILEPGDAVTVNGTTVLILGREQWPSGVINWDVYDAIGWDKTVFQTCNGDEAIWIAYGIPVHPTQEFLEAHPPQW